VFLHSRVSRLYWTLPVTKPTQLQEDTDTLANIGDKK